MNDYEKAFVEHIGKLKAEDYVFELLAREALETKFGGGGDEAGNVAYDSD